MRIKVIGTGGTISVHSDDPLDFRNYQTGVYSIEEIVERATGIERYAEVVPEQFANISSTEMTPEHWIFIEKKN